MISSSWVEYSKDLSLPPSSALSQILGTKWLHMTRDVSFTLQNASQALRQAYSLLNILAYPIISSDAVFCTSVPWLENASWLLDALVDVRLVQKRWGSELALEQPDYVLKLVQQLLSRSNYTSKAGLFPRDKAHALLILLCSDMIANPGELVLVDSTGDDARFVFCKALLTLTQASIKNKTVARLAESRLVNELALLSAHYPALEEQSDVWVSAVTRMFWLSRIDS